MIRRAVSEAVGGVRGMSINPEWRDEDTASLGGVDGARSDSGSSQGDLGKSGDAMVGGVGGEIGASCLEDGTGAGGSGTDCSTGAFVDDGFGIFALREDGSATGTGPLKRGSFVGNLVGCSVCCISGTCGVCCCDAKGV